MDIDPYFNQEWQLTPGPCSCCGTKYRQAKSCWGGGGYMCLCSCWKPCTTCGKCRGDIVPEKLNNDKIAYTGHCKCREKQALIDEQTRALNIMIGW